MALRGIESYVAGLKDFYGSSHNVLDRIRGLTDQEVIDLYYQRNAEFFQSIGLDVEVDTAINGERLGMSNKVTIPMPETPPIAGDNSNIPGGSYSSGNTAQTKIGSTATKTSTGDILFKSGALNNLGQTVETVADRVSLAVMGVNIGAKLGMKIDEALYYGLDKWFNVKVPALNPETWSSLCGQSEIGDFFLRTLFGITDDNMTGYVSADLLAYYYQVLRDAGIWDSGDISADYDGDTSRFPNPSITSISPTKSYVEIIYRPYGVINTRTYQVNGDGYIVGMAASTNPIVTCELFTQDPNCTVTISTLETGESNTLGVASSSKTYNGTNFYISGGFSSRLANTTGLTAYDINAQQAGTILFDGTITEEGGQEGINPMPDSTQYPPTNITGTTPQQVKQQLQQEYPDLFQDAITERVPQDDGTLKDILYVPIPWTTGSDFDTDDATTGDGKDQTSTSIDPETAERIMPTTPQGEQTQPPDTGDGSAPVPAVPTGSASSLWAVYNPSQAQLNSFGAWLWSSDFVEQLKKLFADPMQAIIGVHKVFATPHTGGSQTIKCGYLDSGVSSAIVSSQYTTVDCGSASLREYFGNVFDYDPFTKVSIFLPFIGIVPLNTADVMRSTISVKYKVDVITGACLAEVSVSRDGGGGILYTYGGSAIVTYPVSSGSYVGAVQAAISTLAGIGSAIATGGASLGASVGMIASGLTHAKTQVQHSGQFSGSSGAMGGKKPYLIVSRPQTRTPSKISEYKGIPSNAIHKLSSCTGFVKVNEVHIKSKSAYDNEIQEIESLLKSGVII